MAKKGIFNDPITPKMRKSSPTFAGPTHDQKQNGKFMAAGDYWGTGYKAKIGRMRGDSMEGNPIPPKALRTAPDALA